VIDTVGGAALSPGGSGSVAENLQSPITNFLYLACGCFGSGFIATFCWRATGERQAAIYRKHYLKAIMRQDVGWHDARATTGLASTFAEATQLVETGLGTKLSEGLRFVGQFLGGVGVAFYFQWDLALVLLAISPMSVGAASFLNRVNGQVDRKMQEAFGSAGAACAEVLGAIRTVASFGAERRENARFEGLLAPAESVGIAAGWKRGLAQGLLSATGNLTISAGIVYVRARAATRADRRARAAHTATVPPPRSRTRTRRSARPRAMSRG
jgi:ABC-type multidrug transport system fused ATPase/permease subunit